MGRVNKLDDHERLFYFYVCIVHSTVQLNEKYITSIGLLLKRYSILQFVVRALLSGNFSYSINFTFVGLLHFAEFHSLCIELLHLWYTNAITLQPTVCLSTNMWLVFVNLCQKYDKYMIVWFTCSHFSLRYTSLLTVHSSWMIIHLTFSTACWEKKKEKVKGVFPDCSS